MQRWAPERTCRAGTAPLSRCGPWSFSHISGMLWQCLCWVVKLQNPVHVDVVVWKFTSSFLSIQCKHCCKKLFIFHTAPGVPSDRISMLNFFVVSQNVLCLSQLFYSGLLMDSRIKWILQFRACLRIFLRLYQSLNPAPWLLSFTPLKSAFVRLLMQ